MILPLLETVLRRFHTGLSGSSAFVPHLTLILGMFGGMIAARDGRLLSFSALAGLLKGRLKSAARIFSGALAAVVSAFLCVASVKFVWTEKAGGGRLAYDIPTWIIEMV